MNYMHLICSISFLICSFAFYKIHKLWQKNAVEKNDYKFQIKAGNFKDWIIIIMLLISAIIYFFKSIP